MQRRFDDPAGLQAVRAHHTARDPSVNEQGRPLKIRQEPPGVHPDGAAANSALFLQHAAMSHRLADDRTLAADGTDSHRTSPSENLLSGRSLINK